MAYFAHTDPTDNTRRQLLEDHLKSTGERAASFAEQFSASEWGRIEGLWHDLGKYSDDFQKMIKGVNNTEKSNYPSRVDHSTAGAIYAIQKLKGTGRVLAYLIAGHHAGLPDWQSAESGAAGLAQRLQRGDLLDKVPLTGIPAEIVNPNMPSQKAKPGSDGALWIRMLFSCLVDADFLDTEIFMEPGKASRREDYPPLSDLLPLFEKYMKEKTGSAAKTPVNQMRAEILKQCISMSEHSPGIFTLTVPTGGGKTLSSMAFALHHALKFQKKRIIYVIPYTSIIEQTADQFRQIFGEAVIEHHSNLNTADDTSDAFEKQQLASENWDAPIIVTTSVQFFESLFSSRSSRCRKLHNIVNSIVIFDEAQLLPSEFLNPILHAVRELQRNYGVTAVLTTATQPALGPQKSADFHFEGIPDMVEIIENPARLYEDFKRVEVMVPADLNETQSWEDIAHELKQYPSVLCVVNRRDDARQLYQLMSEGTIHLSALMCGAHRSEVIMRIKRQLSDGIPTRVVSTQLVEAGVDLDFPVVFRALAGLDSIAQAAGRCNREGKPERGKVVVFVPPSQTPPGHLRQAAEIGRRILSEKASDPLALSNYEQYFKELYWLKGDKLDAYGILKDLARDPQLRFSFRTAASKFHIIDDSQQASVLVRFSEGQKLIEELRKTGPDRRLLRKLQRYVVNLPKYIHSRLVSEGSIREIYPGIFVQGNNNLYDPMLGLCPDKSLIYEPDDLII